VPRFLVELYLPQAAAEAAAATSIRCLGSVFVPDDETWFLLYEAPSEDAVRRAVELAALPCARITAAVAP